MAKASTSGTANLGIRAAAAGLWNRLFPPPPPALAAMLARDQFSAVQRQIPMLYLVAIINLLIIDVAFWHQGTSALIWSWTALLMALSLFRVTQLRREARRPLRDADVARQLRRTEIMCGLLITLCSLFACLSYLGGWLADPILVPVSLAFGAFTIAHCLAPLPIAAYTAVIIGILPSSIAMILFGDFTSQVIGTSAATVAVLKLAFLRDHYRQMLDRIDLHHRIAELARTDPLTGLVNRRAFHDSADRALARADSGKGHLALALVDLDGFKPINDALGHAAGDAVLCAVASRLKTAAGNGAHIGRMGGDEFVVLFTDIRTEADLSARTAALLAALVVPFGYEGGRIHCGASIGGARYPEHGGDVDTLLRHADRALYAVKAATRQRRADDKRRGARSADAA